MTDRISQEAYRALTQKQTGTGRSLAEIGEAALQAVGERATAGAWEAQGGEGKTQPAPLESRKRYVAGLDPGVKTGFALWDREEKQFEWVETSTFWGVFFRITESCVLNPANTHIVIEVAHLAPFTFRQRRGKAESFATMDRMARNVGQVTREAQLLVEGFRRLGFTVSEQKPLGKAKKADDDVKQFEQLTGWTKKTSQHARDAARLVYLM